MRTLVGVCLLVASAAVAQNRTFVSSSGLDTNPCSRTQPCRGFNAAIAVVATDGEVVVLDSAGYGPATITKGVSVIAPLGVYAGITVTTNDGFFLNTAGGIINLKGLSFIGLGRNFGINQVGTPAQVNIDSCLFSNFNNSGGGVNVAGTKVTVRDSEFRNNSTGLGASNTISIDHCRFDYQGTAIGTTDSHVAIRDSVFFGGTSGVLVLALNSGAFVTVENCFFSNMSVGITASSGANPARVRLSGTTMVDMTTAMSGSQFVSFGNNRFDGNGTDGTFSSTLALK